MFNSDDLKFTSDQHILLKLVAFNSRELNDVSSHFRLNLYLLPTSDWDLLNLVLLNEPPGFADQIDVGAISKIQDNYQASIFCSEIAITDLMPYVGKESIMESRREVKNLITGLPEHHEKDAQRCKVVDKFFCGWSFLILSKQQLRC